MPKADLVINCILNIIPYILRGFFSRHSHFTNRRTTTIPAVAWIHCSPSSGSSRVMPRPPSDNGLFPLRSIAARAGLSTILAHLVAADAELPHCLGHTLEALIWIDPDCLLAVLRIAFHHTPSPPAKRMDKMGCDNGYNAFHFLSIFFALCAL